MRKIILHNRFTLFTFMAVLSFLLIVLEGALMDRESGRFGFSSPLFDIRITE